jgi:hypothetical protein
MPVQRVRRVIRKVDPWTVLKVTFVFNAVMALVFVLGMIVFWSVFVNAGIPERLNELAIKIGLTNGLSFEGGVYFRIVALLALIGTIMMTGFFTLAAVVYNLISDIVGGIEFVVLEETVTPRVPRRTPPPEVRQTRERTVRRLPEVKPMAPPETGETGAVAPEPPEARRLAGA